MEFSSLWYLSFWSIISQVSLLIALVASDKVNLPVPNFIGDSSDELIYLASCFSSFYAFFVRPMMEPDLTNGNVSNELDHFFTDHLLVLGALLFSIVFWCYRQLTFFFEPYLATALLVPICFHAFSLRFTKSKKMGNVLIGYIGPLLVFPSHSFCCALFTASLFSIACLASCQGLCEPKEIGTVAFSFSRSFAMALLLVSSCLTRVLSPIGSYILKITSGKIDMIEITLGWLGYILAQCIIQEKSVSLLVMLSSFAIYWLANLAMIQPPSDLGTLNFFVGGILDCAISLFGLHKFTWIVFAGCVILVLLQRKLRSVTLHYPRARTSVMSDWRSLEEQIAKERPPLFEFYRAKTMGKKVKQGDYVFILFGDLLICADKLRMEKEAGKEEESKDELIDKLRHFTLHLLNKQKEEEKEEENGKEEENRDELINTLCRLYFQLRNVEENEVGEQTNNYRIALCLYLVLCLLQKEVKGKERKTKDDGQEKEQGKEEEIEEAREKEEGKEEVAEDAREKEEGIEDAWEKEERNEEEIEDAREKEEGKEEKIEDGQVKENGKEEVKGRQKKEGEKEVEEIEKARTKEAGIIRLCRLILGQLLLKRGENEKIKNKIEGNEARMTNILGRFKVCKVLLKGGEKEEMKNKKVKETKAGLSFLFMTLFFNLCVYLWKVKIGQESRSR